MLYLFIGLIVLQSLLFESVQTIVSWKTVVVTRVDKGNGLLELPVEVWNRAVASATIVSVAANSSVIFLTLIDTASAKIKA